MPKESSLYAWLKRGAPVGCVLWRVENSVDLGTPDIFGFYRVAFVIETKVYPKRLTSKQASKLREWAKAGGRAYVLFQMGVVRYLISAADCLPLIGSIDHIGLRQISRERWNMDADEIIDEITKG